VRKNGVNRTLTPISGGVCAPSGFKAGGTVCGLKNHGEKDLAIVLSEKRYPTAAVFSMGKTIGSPVRVSKRHLKNGLAQAIIVNSGKANVFQDDGETLAEGICRLIETKLNVDRTDVLIASTGTMGESLCIQPFETGVETLAKEISADEKGSISAARAIMTVDKNPKQLSYAFEIGEFSCKIGAIYKGSNHINPNMSTLIAVLTTDVNISPQMLQKALETEVRDSFNLINIDGITSPNDTVCIMASGKAGNCKIEYADSEYKKFCYILREVMMKMCRNIVLDGEIEQKLLECTVIGAKSKQVSRTLAKVVVGSQNVKKILLNNALDANELLFAIANADAEVDFSKMELGISSINGEFLLFDAGRALPVSKEIIENILNAKEIKIFIRLGLGNYTSTAFGCY